MNLKDFNEDLILETSSIEELEKEREITLSEGEEDDLQDFYYPPEKPLRFS